MISVIVPVYNTEKYLRRCIDSILAQTYSDFELILIDDGSTDNSGIICDDYAEKDNRIVVIHQDNKGQAIARNVGLDYVFEKDNSEWISFVDSDDCIHGRYLETLLAAGIKNCVKISVCDYTDNSKLFRNRHVNINPVYEKWDAEKFFCEKTLLSVVLWGKVFSRECFQAVRFPDLRMFEDSYIMYKVLFSESELCYCEMPLYYYCQSAESVMRKEWSPEKLASLDLYNQRAAFFKKHGYRKAYNRNIFSYIYDLNDQINQCKKFSCYHDVLKSMRSMLGRYLIKNSRIVNKSLSNKGKYYQNAFPRFYRVYQLCCRWLPNKIHSTAAKAISFIRLRTKLKLHIMSTRETIEYIINRKCSVSRFGDGELGIMLNSRNIGFQVSSKLLKDNLMEAFSNRNENLLICLPLALNNTKGRKKANRVFWINWGLSDNQKELKALINALGMREYCFGDAQITRPYISYKTSNKAKKVFPILKKIWDKRDILIVEGANTCLGVGNDLLSNVTSIKRIIAPNLNAFDYLDEIINAVIDHYSGELVLMALGPTATILASRLCDKGIQALDIGHMDLEYIWYLNKSKEIAPIENRYVNESGTQTQIEECKDEVYQKEIIKRIGC